MDTFLNHKECQLKITMLPNLSPLQTNLHSFQICVHERPFILVTALIEIWVVLSHSPYILKPFINVFSYAEDIELKEFSDEIEGWIIEEFSKAGLDTAKSILEQDVEDLVKRTDLEEETINDVDINYTLYSYITQQGTSTKGYPTVVDSVLVNYSGRRIFAIKFVSLEYYNEIEVS